MAVDAIEHGRFGVLPALLALPPVQAALRDSAAWTDRYNYGRSGASLVLAAAVSNRRDVLDAVLAAGGGVSITVLRIAMGEGFGTCDAEDPARLLQLLLSRGVPPVPPVPEQSSDVSTNPIYCLLETQRKKQGIPWEDACVGAFDGGNFASLATEPFEQLHLQQLRVMEALAAAGYRPTTFRNYKQVTTNRQTYQRSECVLLVYYPPDDAAVAKRWELETGNRWLWRAALQEPRSPATNAAFPDDFRAAAREVLLVAHRGAAAAAAGGQPPAQQARGGGRGRGRGRGRSSRSAAAAAGSHVGAMLLGTLPQSVLLRILALAAYPLSAWRPLPDGGEMWEGLARARTDFSEGMW